MKRLSIKKNGQEVQFANFDNDQAIEDFKQVLASGESWGLPERWLQDTPLAPLTEEQKAQAIETRTVEVMGEMVTEYKMAAEYSVDIEDITAQVQTEKAAKEAREKRKKDRKGARKALDWSKINTVAELKAIVKNLIEEIED